MLHINYNIAHAVISLTADDRSIITSIDTVVVSINTVGALQNHQVVTGGAVYVIQNDRVGVGPITARKKK